MSNWHVQPCQQYSKAKLHPSFRVQRWIQAGHQGAYEMAFCHPSELLCLEVAKLLNAYDEGKHRYITYVILSPEQSEPSY